MATRASLRNRGGKHVPRTISESDADFDTEEETVVSTNAGTAKPKEPTSMKKILTRIAAGWVIIFYCSMLRAGHFYCILVAVLTQFELFRELVNVRYVEAKERAMPLFRTLQWSWFLLAMLFVCKCCNIGLSDHFYVIIHYCNICKYI